MSGGDGYASGIDRKKAVEDGEGDFVADEHPLRGDDRLVECSPGEAGRAGESEDVGGDGRRARPRRRRAVRLSRVDAERMARGEISFPEEALHLDGGTPSSTPDRIVARDANERRLLGDRPPHFGAL